MQVSNATPAVYNDFSGLAQLRQKANADPDAALGEAARQFEAIFVGMMVQAMRQAVPKDTLFGGNQMEAYQDMFDKQLALDLASKGGIGLASIIERQLGGHLGDSRQGGSA